MHTISTDPVPVARRGTARKINQQIVLDLIRQHQPISRADLARSMGVSRAMVGYWVDQLIERGALYERTATRPPRRVGRTPRMLHARAARKPVIAVDVGSTHTSLMLSDADGSQIAAESFDTLYSPDELVQELAFRVRRLFDTRGLKQQCGNGVDLVVSGG